MQISICMQNEVRRLSILLLRYILFLITLIRNRVP